MGDAPGDDVSRNLESGPTQFYSAEGWPPDVALGELASESQAVKPATHYAWALALSPLLILVVATLLNVTSVDVPNTVLSAAGLGVAVGLAVADAGAITVAGGRMSQRLAIMLTVLLGLIYLIVRARRIRGGYKFPLVWCAAMAPSIAVLVLALSQSLPGVYTAESVEQTIADTFPDVFGADPAVSCPGDLARTGDQMVCTVTTDGGAIADVRATLADETGNIRMVILR